MKSVAYAESHIRLHPRMCLLGGSCLFLVRNTRETADLIQNLRGRMGRTICSRMTLHVVSVCVYPILCPHSLAYQHQATSCMTIGPAAPTTLNMTCSAIIFRPFREQHLRILRLILRRTGVKSHIQSIHKSLICRAPCHLSCSPRAKIAPSLPRSHETQFRLQCAVSLDTSTLLGSSRNSLG